MPEPPRPRRTDGPPQGTRPDDAAEFAKLHGWAMPLRDAGHTPGQSRSIGSAQSPGARAFLLGAGTVSAGACLPLFEICWRPPGEGLRRAATLPSGAYAISRKPDTLGLRSRWSADGLDFRLETEIIEVQSRRYVWAALEVRARRPDGQMVQIIGAIRPFSMQRAGILESLAYHTSGLFVADDCVILQDLAKPPDGIRLGNAAQGDSLSLFEGTMPPEGGLSVRDLRENAYRVACPLGLCQGASATFARFEHNTVHRRAWALPFQPAKLQDHPVHLIAAELDAPGRKQPPLCQQHFTQPPSTSEAADQGGNWPCGRGRWPNLRGHLADQTAPDPDSAPAPLPALRLAEIARACRILDMAHAGWTILGRWLLRQGESGILDCPGSDPFAATAAWLHASMEMLEEAPVLSGSGAPFPSDLPWMRAIRQALIGLGQEFRQRGRQGWTISRVPVLDGTGTEHTALARTIVSIGRLACLPEPVVARAERTALLRLRGELLQILSNSIALSLEHSPNGLIPPGAGLPPGPSSIETIEALFEIPSADRPVGRVLLTKNFERFAEDYCAATTGGAASPRVLACGLRLVSVARNLGQRQAAFQLLEALRIQIGAAGESAWEEFTMGTAQAGTFGESVPLAALAATTRHL